MTTRRRLLIAAAAGATLTPALAFAQEAGEMFAAQTGDLGIVLSPEQLAAGTAFLRKHASVDIHCHPGRFFLRDLPADSPLARAAGAPFEDAVAADMGESCVSGALFASVADLPLLELSATTGLRAGREFLPGEAWRDYRRQLAVLEALVGSGSVSRGLDVADIDTARCSGKTACVFSVEGGDFIEDRLERVAQAHRDGVRAITIVHFHTNQIGDPQTEAPRWNGLTPLGRDIVRAMNQAGILVDLAHASFDTTKQAAEVSDRPMMISHTNLQTPDNRHPRLVSLEHARLVTESGGIVGSVPWGIGQRSFGDWIEAILGLIEAVGVDHVAVGTDMDANFRPVFADYSRWGLIPAALLARGLTEEETAKVVGGNFLRLMAAQRG
ncbi:membrane dipeptidase [uncultured Brevundimonas sp.]|uniref:dipeptidase n=1 Tax=uncultured Brevundimonas sp. TaxID=213418 RepID=UPI00260E32F7|nr:membrane dipeptidase [uncultured Brevundimonas sp.]